MASLYIYRKKFRGNIRAEVRATIRRLAQLAIWDVNHRAQALLGNEPTVDPSFNVRLAVAKLSDVLKVRLAELKAIPK